MASAVGGFVVNATASRSTTNTLGQCTINVTDPTVKVISNHYTSDRYLHARVLINGQQVSYHYKHVPRRSMSTCYLSNGSLVINKTTGAQSISVVIQASSSASTSPGSWTSVTSYTVTVPALSISHYDFYNDEAMTDLYKRIDVYETQYLTVPSAIPSVAMSEWVDSDGTVYQFDAQVQNTSMQELTYKFRPVFLPSNTKIKVKVKNEWIDGDVKCKINDKWLDADAIYVKINDTWIKI